METRYAVSKKEVSTMTTEQLRETFLLQNLFEKGKLNLVYSHIDRIIAGGCIPVEDISLPSGAELKAAYFLERREMGVICIFGSGEIVADGISYPMKKYDCLYLTRGTKEVTFRSDDKQNPAFYYINSTPAHRACKTVHIPLEKAVHVTLGSDKDCNKRTINKYIIPGVVDSCQLTMGLTILAEGSVWNTMPTHTHERRMEVYLYFDIAEGNVVFHMMGAPEATKHIVMNNYDAVISPSWSIHSGVGTKDYTFIWGMCGENQEFDDMQGVKTTDLL
ncbi:MAG: 5-dehydro-4-deoxy-D-glucuronate isomerase [Clostridia bacterium]|nr:5-dehydro-4-deoxy-D-glucuronate isomerase [Clostridia bacterium]